MGGIDSVLVVFDRGSDVLAVAQKACVIARHFAARLELFVCDAGQAAAGGVLPALQQRLRDEHLADSQRFLSAIRSAIAADDLHIAQSAACTDPQYDGVLSKVRRAKPDLVVRSLARSEDRRRASAMDEHEWHLARTCPAPILFTRGKPWRPSPRVGACVPGLPFTTHEVRDVVAHSERLALGCSGQSLIVGPTALHQFEDGLDVVVMPAPRPGQDLPNSGLVDAIIERLNADFLLVPAPVAPIELVAPLVQ